MSIKEMGNMNVEDKYIYKYDNLHKNCVPTGRNAVNGDSYLLEIYVEDWDDYLFVETSSI